MAKMYAGKNADADVIETRIVDTAKAFEDALNDLMLEFVDLDTYKRDRISAILAVAKAKDRVRNAMDDLKLFA